MTARALITAIVFLALPTMAHLAILSRHFRMSSGASEGRDPAEDYAAAFGHLQ